MKKKVLIIGGGFGGLSAAKELGAYPDLFDVHLYDRRNYHLFQPLLYQVATAGLSPSDIAVPIRSILSSYKNVSVVLEEVTSINPETKTVSTPKGEVAYDYLISACGSRHSYFGKDEWEDFAPGLKTLEMATEIRRRILTSFESAEIETNPEEKRAAMSFVVMIAVSSSPIFFSRGITSWNSGNCTCSLAPEGPLAVIFSIMATYSASFDNPRSLTNELSLESDAKLSSGCKIFQASPCSR
jgi:hypothetical protein